MACLFLDNLRKSSFVKSSGTYGPESVVGEVTVCLHQCTFQQGTGCIFVLDHSFSESVTESLHCVGVLCTCCMNEWETRMCIAFVL